MPWDAHSFKKHNKGLSSGQSSKAASIANSVLKSSGGDEGKAIRIANAVIRRQSGRSTTR